MIILLLLLVLIAILLVLVVIRVACILLILLDWLWADIFSRLSLIVSIVEAVVIVVVIVVLNISFTMCCFAHNKVWHRILLRRLVEFTEFETYI